LYASPNIVRMVKSKMRWVEHVARMGEIRNAYNILVGKTEEKRQLGRTRLRWEDNIVEDLREIGWEDVDRMHLTQDRDQWWSVKNTVMKLWVDFSRGIS